MSHQMSDRIGLVVVVLEMLAFLVVLGVSEYRDWRRYSRRRKK